MEITLRHGLEYETTEIVAVEDLIKSLEANDRLLRSAGKLLTSIMPGLTIETKKISVIHISQESPLKEILAYSCLIVYQDELIKEVPALVEKVTGMPVSEQYDAMITVIVMVIAIYGVSKAFEVLFPARDKSSLAATEGTLLRRASELTGVAAERIRGAAEVLFTGRSTRAMVSASQKIFAPTRGQAAEIRSERGDVLVSREAVQEAQLAAGLPFEQDDDDRPNTSSEFHSAVKIVLHAMDRDSKRRGWAAHVPSIFDERIEMDLEKTMRPESIFGKNEIVGDILLTREEDEDGNMKPKDFLLIRAYL